MNKKRLQSAVSLSAKRRLSRGACSLILPAFAFFCLMPAQASGTPYYIGIGNDTPGDPKGAAADNLGNALSRANPGIKKTVKHDIGGRDILSALNTYKDVLKSCDILIFYYIGHGWPEQQDNPPPDPGEEKSPKALTKWDEYIGKPGEDFNKLARDDELASILAGFPKCVTKIVIFDSCFSGGMVGGTGDIDAVSDNTAWLTSAAENERDPGLFNLGTYLAEGLEKEKSGLFKADKNKDGKVMIDEWFNYGMKGLEDTHNHGKINWGSNIDEKHWKPVASVPEPASLFLVGAGLIGLAGMGRRSAKKQLR